MKLKFGVLIFGSIILLKTEVEKLRLLGELNCSNNTADKLRKISFRTIDEKLKDAKVRDRMRIKYAKKNNPLLYQKIPVKLSDEWDRSELGNIQIDLVEHCGQSAGGEYIYSLSCCDIATGWWEGEATMNRGQEKIHEGLRLVRARSPFKWREIHSDNGTEFINDHLYKYTKKSHLDFSRSRPNKKNDNCFVEQKNWTHIKKFVGYVRYDSNKELELLNDLYENELRLFKNFFQPVMKLTTKIRVGGKVHRKYDVPQTPFQRVLASKEVSKKTKQELTEIYESLNPAELKRKIDAKLINLYNVYQEKNRGQKVEPKRKQKPATVRFLIAQPKQVSVR